MGCITSCGRIVLILINLVILLVSLALVVLGVLMKFFPGSIVETLLAKVEIPSSSAQDFGSIPSVGKIINFPFFADLGVALLIFGCILFVISFCACCGACGKWRPLLLVFIIAMIVLILGQAVVGGLFLAKDSILHEKIKETFGDEVTKNYKDGNSNAISIAMDILNLQLDCCGFRGPKDFALNPKVKTCCRKKIISSPSVKKCVTEDLSDTQTFNDVGCYDKIQEKIQDKIVMAAVILSVILLLQLLEVVFAILLVKDAGQVSPV
ncbi:tetraspanin-18-like [Pomacea canaliculata]|uniref:tetraspanin-18-like n=1 Tax=Pomacea canaliculata TaxID=400727 RepID=UPI000D72DF59|nr:tetraspanin-18-like [Pomacea canaliculata]